SAPGRDIHDSTTPAPCTASTTTPMSKSVAEIGLRSLALTCRRQMTLVAATTIVSRGPRSTSEATSIAHDTGKDESIVPNGSVTRNVAVNAASAIMAANSTACWGASPIGGRTATTTAAMTITEAV